MRIRVNILRGLTEIEYDHKTKHAEVVSHIPGTTELIESLVRIQELLNTWTLSNMERCLKRSGEPAGETR